MAVGIWLTVHKFGEPATAAQAAFGPSITYPLSVQAVSASSNVGAAQLDPDTVNATVTGSPDVMNHLQASQIHALVNLTGINSARNLTCDVEIALPRGAMVLHIDPPQVAVTLAKP